MRPYVKKIVISLTVFYSNLHQFNVWFFLRAAKSGLTHESLCENLVPKLQTLQLIVKLQELRQTVIFSGVEMQEKSILYIEQLSSTLWYGHGISKGARITLRQKPNCDLLSFFTLQFEIL
jgi:hypothetical protein